MAKLTIVLRASCHCQFLLRLKVIFVCWLRPSHISQTPWPFKHRGDMDDPAFLPLSSYSSDPMRSRLLVLNGYQFTVGIRFNCIRHQEHWCLYCEIHTVLLVHMLKKVVLPQIDLKMRVNKQGSSLALARDLRMSESFPVVLCGICFIVDPLLHQAPDVLPRIL